MERGHFWHGTGILFGVLNKPCEMSVTIKVIYREFTQLQF